MNRFSRTLIIAIISLVVTACAQDTNLSNTLEANHAAGGTQIADLRTTATVQAARAQITVDAVDTQAALAATQGRFLESTLADLGTPEAFFQTQRAEILGNSATPIPTQLATQLLSENDSDDMGDSQLLPTSPPVTRFAPILTVTPTPFNDTNIEATTTGTQFGQMTVGETYTATGAGDDGCGAGITATFGMDVQEIYVITPANNIPANSVTFSAIWQREGQPIGPVYDYTPDFAADELCIWLFVDPTDFEFTPGSYSVQVQVNGQDVNPPVTFTIQ